MGFPLWPRGVAHAALAASCLLLSGCLLTPGAFKAELTLTGGGAYAFAYDGEIAAVGLSQLASMGGTAPFEPACSDDDGEKRECTAAEAAEQKAEWERQREREAKDRQQMVRAIGGIDPADPDAARKLAAILSKQAGFRSVVHKGDGVYAVNYRAEGRLSHGFVFPLVERMPTVTPFVVAIPRADGSVRVEAPGFGGAPAFGDLPCPWRWARRVCVLAERGHPSPIPRPRRAARSRSSPTAAFWPTTRPRDRRKARPGRSCDGTSTPRQGTPPPRSLPSDPVVPTGSRRDWSPRHQKSRARILSRGFSCPREWEDDAS
ncbi:hypothetical protein [Croceicoccus sp. BE223]|uniref:hypothetical protein n=1 Tax=Croceicoccus sp. BE223 TaxID=2817716 RepID=UPI00285F4F6D|nr:hypothetical protein [Croceicoccus sp. BE223]MDR7101256.1 hypothetical protein [Croceicoccus sp. BE223]